MEQKYFDDFHIGERFEGPSRTLTDAHLLLIAALTGDTHPIHYDAEYAVTRGFRERVAHGLLLASMTALGATSLSPLVADSMIAFVEQSARFKRPAVIGDTVRPVAEVAELVPKTGDRGLVRFRVAIVDMRGLELVEGYHVYLIKTRTSPPPGARGSGPGA